jgi:hypothetical protein
VTSLFKFAHGYAIRKDQEFWQAVQWNAPASVRLLVIYKTKITWNYTGYLETLSEDSKELILNMKAERAKYVKWLYYSITDCSSGNAVDIHLEHICFIQVQLDVHFILYFFLDNVSSTCFGCYLHSSLGAQLQRTAIGFVWFGVSQNQYLLQLVSSQFPQKFWKNSYLKESTVIQTSRIGCLHINLVSAKHIQQYSNVTALQI